MNKRLKEVLENRGGNYILPFFWQHGEDEATLRKYMSVIRNANISAVCVESRSHPDYCGPRWWHDMDIILDEARKRGMKVWILDDSHFPTGFANGAMKTKPDSLCRRSITCKIIDSSDVIPLVLDEQELAHPEPLSKTEREKIFEQFSKPENRSFNDDRLLAVVTRKNQAGKVKTYILHITGNAGYNRTYINMMDKESCRVLIDAVYKPHYAHYKNDFGKTIAGFFSDEPELGNGRAYEQGNLLGTEQDLPWSRDLETLLRDEWGSDFESSLPLLWENEADPELMARVRCSYMDKVSRLVEKNFSYQIGDWCREHGVEYIGHIIEDNNQHARTGSSLGHYFRSMSGQDMAGIDEIGNQVCPNGEDEVITETLFGNRDGEFFHCVLGKLCSSYAAIDPLKKGRAMCEIFGAGGWQEGVRREKYLVDHFLVRGVNRYVPHAFSPAPFPDPDCPPHFYAQGHNPQYRHFGALMAYLNRVCALIDGGRHISPVAVLYHAEAEWGSVGQSYMLMQKPCRILADNQIDFDIIPQDVFTEPERYKTIMGRTLRVNTQEYRALVIPYTRFITTELAKAIEKMNRLDFPVMFVNSLPKGMIPGKAVQTTPLNSLSGFLRERAVFDISIIPHDNHIRYFRYLHNDGSVIYIFNNEGGRVYRGVIRVSENMPCAVYNAWDNRLEKVNSEAAENGKQTHLHVEIEPFKAAIIVFDGSMTAETLNNLKEPLFPAGSPVQLIKGWKRSLCRGIEYPGFKGSLEVAFPDKLAEEQPEFSGFARYENVFSVTGVPLSEAVLEITDAYEGVEVFVNEVSAGIQIVPPFRFDVLLFIREGENHLAIEVATNLERQVGHPGFPDADGNTEPLSLSGITGPVFLYFRN
jgi:hypothetical protein